MENFERYMMNDLYEDCLDDYEDDYNEEEYDDESNHWNALIQNVAFRFGGLLLVLGTVLLLNTDILYDATLGGVDGTFALVSIPLGLLMIFAPCQGE